MQQLRDDGPPDLLVVDAAGVFAAAGEPARAALGRAMQLTWEVTRAVAGALIEQQRPGRIVLVAPAAGADPGDAADDASHARATRAGLENLARTTSIEWARYGITPVAIAPGPDTTGETLAALCAYLASPAGAYFSGCVLALEVARRRPEPTSRARTGLARRRAAGPALARHPPEQPAGDVEGLAVDVVRPR